MTAISDAVDRSYILGLEGAIKLIRLYPNQPDKAIAALTSWVDDLKKEVSDDTPAA